MVLHMEHLRCESCQVVAHAKQKVWPHGTADVAERGARVYQAAATNASGGSGGGGSASGGDSGSTCCSTSSRPRQSRSRPLMPGLCCLEPPQDHVV